ncbi:GtrA family protein [Thiomonas delicata]|uniref:GtrA family protein n=1 Tax=Thiomonas delicata TaxID=364030 RepID=UPI000B8EC458|nr:GtrA family protein [Thiomonas delicata]
MKISTVSLLAVGGRFVRFAVVGASGTAIQYIVLGLGVEWLHWSPVDASAAGYILGSISNYGLNHAFTFRSARRHSSAAPRYFMVLGIGWLINTGSMAILVNAVHVNYWIAQIFVTGFGLIWNFLGSHFWAFREVANPAAEIID